MKKQPSATENEAVPEIPEPINAKAVAHAKPDVGTIAELAYSLWEQRGCPNDCPDNDWLEAEKRLGVST